MTKKPAKHVDQALVTAWLDRYNELEARLSQQPDGQWAWLWRVRRDILFYLLSQYGPSDWSTEHRKQSSESGQDNAATEESISSYVQQAADISAGTGAKYPLRDQGAFRSRLHHLRSINDKVRAEYPVDMNPNIGVDPRALIIRTTYPESPRSYENKRHNEVLLEVFSRELEGIRSYLQENGHSVPEDAPLTENDVLAILLGDEANEADRD